MIFQDYYSTPGVRETCHQMKEGDGYLREKAITKAAIYLAQEGGINSTCYLIPAPQHSGRALYTKDLCEKIAHLTGACVLDIVRCHPHDAMYEQKQERPGCLPEAEFFLEGFIPEDGTLLFIDNVISTGETFNRINVLFGGALLPMPYAVDYTRLADEKILALLKSQKELRHPAKRKKNAAKHKTR